MRLLGEVITVLREAGAPHAMIGATAMAALGVSRSTQDLDLLTTDRGVLRSGLWSGLADRGASIEIRQGDIRDPLVGVVRVTRADERPVDVIVGEGAWQDRILRDASPRVIADLEVPVVGVVGLILLKLYAGGPQDRWDVEQLLAISADRDGLVSAVEAQLPGLLPRCRRLWERLGDPGG